MLDAQSALAFLKWVASKEVAADFTPVFSDEWMQHRVVVSRQVQNRKQSMSYWYLGKSGYSSDLVGPTPSIPEDVKFCFYGEVRNPTPYAFRLTRSTYAGQPEESHLEILCPTEDFLDPLVRLMIRLLRGVLDGKYSFDVGNVRYLINPFDETVILFKDGRELSCVPVNNLEPSNALFMEAINRGTH